VNPASSPLVGVLGGDDVDLAHSTLAVKALSAEA
jgi:hypothetical protein